MHPDRIRAEGNALSSAPPIEVELDGNTITLKVARASFVSEGNSLIVAGVAPTQWARTLKRWGVPFAKSGRLHVAKLEDVQAAIESFTRKRATTPASSKRSVEAQSAAILAQIAGGAR